MRTAAFLLSLVVVFMIPWENAVTLGEWGTLTRAIGMLAAAVWLASALGAREFRKPHPFHLAIFFFVLWNMASVYWTVDVDETVQHIKSYVQLAILAWILWDLYTSQKALRAALEAYILGAYVTIGSTMSNYLIGRGISVSGDRYAGAGLNAVDLSLILALGLPVAWHLSTSAGNSFKDRVLRLVNYAYIPASLFAVILTASRTALFAIVPAVLYIVGTATRLKPSSRILIFVFFIGTLFALQPHIPQATVDRLATIDDTIAAGDVGGRMKLWSGSMATFSEHPLLGVGSGALHTPTVLGSVAHNTFLSVLAELGLIGFIFFCAVLAIVAYQAVNQPKWLSGLWITVLAIWAIGVFALTWEYTKQTWLFLSLVVISANLLSVEAEAAELENSDTSASSAFAGIGDDRDGVRPWP
jgi:O-antigen ligase